MYKTQNKIIMGEKLNLYWLNDQLNFFIYYREEILNFKEILIKLKIEFFLSIIVFNCIYLGNPSFFMYGGRHL